jgi:hypothetical protein
MQVPPETREVSIHLALPGADQCVREWMAPAANSPDMPLNRSLHREPPVGPPAVIFAETKPRLSGPELLARHGGTGRASPHAQDAATTAVRRAVPAAKTSRAAVVRLYEWSARLLVAIAWLTGTPVF